MEHRVVSHEEWLAGRRELAAGWCFRSNSDTECIVAAYQRYGTECLGRRLARRDAGRDFLVS